MKKGFIISLVVSALLFVNSAFAQINSNSPAVPFGSRSSYPNGIMPTVLPTSGTYTKSQDAADAYNAWKSLVQSCTNGSRVLFDDGSATVSEGIAYGMLLSAYAGDKPLFDNLWKYYKAHSNANGVMNWKYSNCDSKAGDNGATDAEEDAALALIIAEEQWPTATSPYDYKAEATTLIGKIRQFEVHNTTYQVLNGDAWGTTNTCRNPSYFAPAYFREYAKIETSQAAFWNSTTSTSQSFLLTNRNSTTGLVGNWADNNAANNTCNGPNEFGWDAIRNPWRMATDVLWNGTATATTGADICSKMSNWAKNDAANLKGPCATNAANPSSGSYKNGTFSMIGLAFMGTTGTTYQTPLNTAYTNIVALGNNEVYFSRTLRCITLFMMTGNFWKPGSSGVAVAPTYVSGTTNGDGLKITLTFDQAIALNGTTASAFTLKIGGTTSAGAITAIAMNGTTSIDLTIAAGKILPGNVITIDYTAGAIKSTATGTPSLASFTNKPVANALAGNTTLIDDCEDNNSINNLGGKWFTYTDKTDGGLSTITPTTTPTVLFPMQAGGGASTPGYYAKTTYTLSKGTNTYDPYVGLGTYPDPDTLKTANWSTGTGISFWYKGGACEFKVVTKLPTGKTEDYAFYFYSITASAAWKKVTIPWASFATPSWAPTPARSTFDRTVIEKLQWQITTTTGTTGEISVDDLTVDAMAPTATTAITVSPTSTSIMVGANTTLTNTFTPTTSTYKSVVWSSSNTAVATVDANGKVIGVAAGTATITCTSKMYPAISGSCALTVTAPTVLPTSVTVTPATTTGLAIGSTATLTATIAPTNATDKTVTWTSSNTAVATVSATGVVTAVGAGTATITATSVAAPTIKGTASVTVVNVLVTSITLSSTTLSIVLGNTSTLTPTIAPTNATNKNVTWSSSNTAVATVSATGVISTVATGTATITCTAADGSGKTATCAVTVTGILVTSVAVAPTTVSIVVGNTSTITPTILPANASNKTLNWTTSAAGVATVSAAGVITAVAVGTCTITATAADGSGKSATVAVTVTPILVTGITMTPTTSTMYVGDLLTLTATVAPANAANKTLTWTSSNTAVATVSAAGVVTAVALGTTTITATSSDGSAKTATCAITVSPRLVTSITMTPTTATINIAGTTTLTASVLPANATNTAVNWSSSATGVATVSASGVVTGVSIGTATITATAADGSGKTATCVVTVSSILVSSVAVTPTTVSIVVGSTSTITPTVLPANATNGSLNWTTSAAGIATVSASGVITAVAVGTATITATAADGSGKSATVAVTVTPLLVSSIALTPTTSTMYAGDLLTVTSTVLPANATNKNINWTTSAAGVATVSAAGVVTAVAVGTATITATAADGSGKTATCIITVSPRLVTGITMAPTTATMYVGDNTTLTATVAPANATNTTVTWTSSNTSVATVSASGVVTALAIGSATITATANDASGKTATCAVTVAPRLVTSVALAPTTVSIVIGNTSTITPTVLPANASNATLNWSTSAAGIATVSASGVITAVAIGTATITATATDGSGISATVAVTVTPLLVSGITMTPSTATLFIGDNTTLTATVTPANASNTAVNWSSSNTAVATVSASGVVTGVTAGTATITATAADGSGITATCAVTVNAVLPTSVSTSSAIGFLTGDPAQTLTATVLPANATDKSVTWTSSNTAVATVNPTTGVVTPVGVGSCVITVSCVAAPAVTASCNVTVDASVTNVTGITVSPTTLSIQIGSTGTITPTVSPTNATDKSVTWSSSNTAVATVANGVVSALTVGTSTITVTTTDGSFTATCIVTVTPVNVTGVTLDQTTLSLTMASSAVQLTATVAPVNATDKTVIWTSSNPAAASVSATGLVTPVGIGTAIITVTTTDGAKTATCAVTVSTIPVTGVTLDQTTLSLNMQSAAVQLTATVAPANATDKTVTWTSSNPAAASVSATGLVTPVGIGTTTITVTTTDGSKTAICAVIVSAIPVTGIVLNPTTLSLTMSSTPTAIVATVSPATATNNTLNWTSSNSAIATVSASGVVTPTGIGTAIITATATDGSGISTTCAVTVSSIAVTGVTIDQSTLSLAATSSPVQLVATIAPADATNKNVSWVSSNTSVVTVSATGLVTVIGIGTSTITVTTVDGSFIATCAVTVSSIPVTAITLSQSSLALTMSSAPVTLTPTFAPVTASDKSVTWTSSNPAAASVNASGVVTPTGLGSTTITATANDGSGITATCSVIVSAIAVTSVTLDQTTVSVLPTSLPVQLVATVNPTDATNKNVTWTSSNPSVATVSATGVVSLTGTIGTTTITVTTVDGGKTANCIVTVSAIPVTGMSLDQSNITMTMSSAPVTIVPTISPANASDKTVTWTSSNPSVATVSASGVVTPISIGNATITATANGASGITATTLVTVNAIPVTSVSLDKTTLALNVGNIGALTATVLPTDATNKAINWTSSNTSVATVDASGVVTAVAAGTATITATTVDGSKTATCAVTVSTTIIAVTGVSVTPTTATIQINQTAQISAIIAPSNATNTNVNWTSSNPSVATVSATGLVSPLTVGTVTITATTVDGSFTASATVTITNILTTSISITNSLAVSVGNTGNLTATVNPIGASTNVTWSSSNPSVATVSATGVVTGVAAGTATITATATDGTAIVSNGSLVTVSVVHVSGLTVSPAAVILTIGAGTTTLTPTIAPANATDKSVTWSVDNSAIVTVNNGVVTPVSKGTAIVTVTSVDNNYTATCNVQVVDKAVLVSTITTVQATHDAAVVGTAIGQYPASAKTTLQTAINTAQAVVSNTSATQTQIDDAITALLKAQSDFAKKQIVNETLIFNAELDNLTYLNTYWYTFDDNKNGATSVVTPKSTAVIPFPMTAPGANGTENAAKVSYTLNKGTYAYNPFVGVGMDLNINPDDANKIPYDLSGSTGMSFWYKSDKNVYLEVGLSTITDYANYYILLNATTDWTEMKLNWSEFTQYTWGAARPWDLSKVTAFQWKVEGNTDDVGQLWVDEVKILGKVLDLPALNIVDKSVLETTITDAQAIVTASVVGAAEGQYPSAAKATFLTAISTANTVFTSTTATQTEVDDAVTALLDATSVFQGTVIHVNKTALATAIATATTAITGTTEGVANGQYPAGSKTTFQNAINAATTVNVNNLATQAQVDAALLAIQTATTTFINSKIVVDKTALAALISSSQVAHDTSTEGTADGEYPVGAKADLQTAINNASIVNTTSTVSQTQVNTAKADLQTALDIFLASVNTSGPVDKTALAAKITQAQGIYGTSVEGVAEGQYPSGSKNILLAAISTAQGVNNNGSATQAQVNIAVINLNNAILDFQGKVIHVDKSILASTIADAQTLYGGATEGTADGQYPAGSKNNLLAAINSAITVNGAALASQGVVDQEVLDLLDAMNTFEGLQIHITLDKTGLTNKIASANTSLDKATGNTGNNPGNYPSSAVADLINAISAAESVLATATTQVQLTNATTALQNAISLYEASVIPEVVDKTILAELIAQADVLFETTVIGSNPGEYGQLEYFDLYSATNSSRTALNDDSKTQVQINAQVDILRAAIDAYNASKVPTDIKNIEDVNVMVWPNPCVEKVTITSANDMKSISLVNILGSVQVAKKVNGNQTTLDVSKLANGVYFVKIECKNGTVETVKITKK